MAGPEGSAFFVAFTGPGGWLAVVSTAELAVFPPRYIYASLIDKNDISFYLNVIFSSKASCL
ncbi:hypothetical protein VU11_05905 [Desulfobulbus sp. US2]|nr:hypothetical protein [Desulfobulbus sp. US2]WLE98991.1 MAG: hypothetical protein QTN59_09165 [Candidatus Electrothrix communis]